jgi:triosephosphate isomerase
MKYIFGNWKMNHGPAEAENFFRELSQGELPEPSQCKIGIATPSPLLSECSKLIKELEIPVELSSQNCHWEKNGAFTGELSPLLLRELGINWTLVAHSERRQFFGETNESANKRIKGALEAGLNVIYCIGETLEQRESGQTEEVLSQQLKEGLKELDPSSCQGKLVIAYEPVWAIGTGKTATPELAENTHKFIISTLSPNFDLPVIYGGSVKPENASELMGSPSIHGALVGGASLNSDSFLKIIAGAL